MVCWWNAFIWKTCLADEGMWDKGPHSSNLQLLFGFSGAGRKELSLNRLIEQSSSYKEWGWSCPARLKQWNKSVGWVLQTEQRPLCCDLPLSVLPCLPYSHPLGISGGPQALSLHTAKPVSGKVMCKADVGTPCLGWSAGSGCARDCCQPVEAGSPSFISCFWRSL